jgi:hypothetical protein
VNEFWNDDDALTTGDPTLMQTVFVCEEHDECHVIVGYQYGREVWRSHAPDTVPVEPRLNMDWPTADDYRGISPPKPQRGAAGVYEMPKLNRDEAVQLRWRLPTDEELEREEVQALGWDHDARVKMAAYAARKGIASLDDLASGANVDARELGKVAGLKRVE